MTEKSGKDPKRFLRVVREEEKWKELDPFLLRYPSPEDTVEYIMRVASPNYDWDELDAASLKKVEEIFAHCLTQLIASEALTRNIETDEEFARVPEYTKTITRCDAFIDANPPATLKEYSQAVRGIFITHLITYAQRPPKLGVPAHNPAFSFLLRYSGTHPGALMPEYKNQLSPEGRTIMPPFDHRASEEYKLSELGKELSKCKSVEEMLAVLEQNASFDFFSNPSINRRVTLNLRSFIEFMTQRVEDANLEMALFNRAHSERTEITAEAAHEELTKVLNEPWFKNFNGYFGTFNITEAFNKLVRKQSIKMIEFIDMTRKPFPLNARNGWLEVFWWTEAAIGEGYQFHFLVKDDDGNTRINNLSGKKVIEIVKNVPADRHGLGIKELPNIITAKDKADIRLLYQLREKLQAIHKSIK